MSTESWSVRTLGDVSHVEMGQSPPSEFVSDQPGNGIAFLQGNAEFTNKFPRPRLWCTRPPKLARPGDILISVRAPVGAINRADRQYGIGRGLAAVRFTGIDPDFGYHALARFSVALHRVSQGTTFDAIGGAQLRSLTLPHYPRPEQRRIAEILTTLDQAISDTTQLIAKLELMKQGLLQDLFTRGIDESGALRDPERHPEQFKDSPVGHIPLGWDVQSLEHWVRPEAPITYGIVQAGPNIASGVPYIRTGDMAGDRLSLHGLLRTSRSIAKAYKRSEVRSGEIVCAIRATVGKVLPVPQELDGANLTQGTARISPGVSVHSGFLLWAIRGLATQRQIARQKKGTTFQEITLRELRQLLVAVPISKDEQSFVAGLMERYEARQRTESTYLAKVLALRTGMSEDLLTGHVRVTKLLAGDAA